MSIFDKYGNFVYLNNGILGKEEEEEEEKKRQEQLCELMYMYQQFRGIVSNPQYVSRASKLRCEYGAEYVRIDCLEDYGIYRSMLPLLTTMDCKPQNIHDFGSCFCPEENYRGRLPMTAASDTYGRKAIKASYNEYPHICIPLIDEEHGWRQIDEDLLVEVNKQGYAPMLLDNAVLWKMRMNMLTLNVYGAAILKRIHMIMGFIRQVILIPKVVLQRHYLIMRIM